MNIKVNNIAFMMSFFFKYISRSKLSLDCYNVLLLRYC